MFLRKVRVLRILTNVGAVFIILENEIIGTPPATEFGTLAPTKNYKLSGGVCHIAK